MSSLSCRPPVRPSKPASTAAMARESSPPPATRDTAPKPAAPSPRMAREWGPLALRATMTPPPTMNAKRSVWRKNQAQQLDRKEMEKDLTLLRQVAVGYLDGSPAAGRPALADLKRTSDSLTRSAPDSVHSFAGALSSWGRRYGICVFEPGLERSCYSLQGTTRPDTKTTEPPFSIVSEAAGIKRLAVRELTADSLPVWQKSAAELTKLATARGLIVDLRQAWGSDFRPLWPLVTRLVGASPSRPCERFVDHRILFPTSKPMKNAI